MIEDYLAEMHAESAAPPEDDGPHLIGDDIPCISCSYNLRGLMSDGTCPECGESVARSVKGDYLMYCDPRWVGNLATGMNFLVASIVAAIAIAVFVLMLSRSAQGEAGLTVVVSLIPATIGMIGYWIVTTPDPGKRGAGALTARTLARWGMVVNFALSLLSIGFAFAESGVAEQGADAVAAVAGLIGTFALFVYARSLALRVPNSSLAKHTSIVMWGYCSILVVGLLMLVVLVVTMAGGAAAGGAAGLGPLAAIGCVVGLGGLVFGIWALVLIVWYRREAVRAARHARSSWARGI